jgi:glyoxylate reductase
MARVFVTRRLPGTALERLAEAHDVDIWEGDLPPDPEELERRAREADGLLTLLTDVVDSALLSACPHLRAIANYAVGADNIDLEAVGARGIAVGNTPDVLTEATADLAFALILACARNLVPAHEDFRAGRWHTWEPAGWLGADVHGATLGIVGFGRIGRAVARRAQGFDMTVLHHDPAGGVSLDEVLAASDYISLHCPLSPQTHHLIDATALERMRPTARLINTARGPIVDAAALRWALEAGVIAGAALDVTDPEPLPPDHPLGRAPNLLVVPHIGSATHTARARMADLAVDNLLAALAGEPMPHRVDAGPRGRD